MRADAELQKLAHTLGVEPGRLTMLAGLPAEDLRELRRQAGAALFEADKLAFSRVAALSKVVPSAVSARLSQAVLPPMLAARTAELLEPARAVDLVGRLSDGYLADVSEAMEPSRAREVVQAIPPERIAHIGTELARRGDWIVIGGFVSAVTLEALAQSISVFEGGHLLRIGFVLEDLSRLDDIAGMITDTQLDELIAAAAADELWDELSTLLENLAPERAARLAGRLAQAPAEVREKIAAAPLTPAASAALEGS